MRNWTPREWWLSRASKDSSVSDPVRVLIVDDQELVRTGFTMILSSEADLEVVGEVDDGVRAAAAVAEHQPDVVLMDVQMPLLDGISATQEVVAEHPDVRVLILTTFDDDEYLFSALDAGASGFLLKNCPPDDLIAAVRVVAQGHSLLAPEVTQRVISRSSSRLREVSPGIDDLTDRERDVLMQMARGFSNSEIAGGLYVSEATVKTHVSRILTKLDVRDRVQAVIVAHESGLMDQA